MRRPVLAALLIAAAGVSALMAQAATRFVPRSTAAFSFASYPAPTELGSRGGEPSIGSNWLTGATLVQADTRTLKVTFDDTRRPAVASWSNVSFPEAVLSLDPILWTDSASGTTIESQLLAACSSAAITTNDGGSWFPSQGCGPGALVDHQTIGGGPYHSGLRGVGSSSTLAVYYCAQAALTEACARSDTGGLTFNPAVPIYNIPGLNDNASGQNANSCAGLSGHLKVAPDGTVYVPNFGCGGKVALAASADNGLTWNVRTVPGSTTQKESDPSVGIGSAGTLYLGWEDGANNAQGSTAAVSVSHDHGITWTKPFDVGAAVGVHNVQFPEVIAGDDNRAAFAFLGSPTRGDDQAGGEASSTPVFQVFPGVFHLYVAMTTDGGSSWTTVDVTPNDPVQRGCIWLHGGGGSCRNLLDFNDITVDKRGRVVLVYADGCIGTCVRQPLSNTEVYDDSLHSSEYRAQLATVVRQASGKGLFARYDGQI